MNPNNAPRGEQWDTCDRCGFAYPMSYLTKQKGLLVCSKDVDNLDVERREEVISQILNVGIEDEGADMRVIDRAFFESRDEEIY